MGLDMYAWLLEEEPASDEDLPKEMEFYWRKNYDLHHWMFEQWDGNKGLNPGDFNCELVVLKLEQLQKLYLDYFTRNKEYGIEITPETTEFISKAIKWLEEDTTGKRVVLYDSWW